MQSSSGLEKISPGKLLDVLIQAGLIAALVALCYRIFAPFLTLMLETYRLEKHNVHSGRLTPDIQSLGCYKFSGT